LYLACHSRSWAMVGMKYTKDREITVSGVGTELAKQIPEWAVQTGRQCKCKDMQAKMDRWGPDGCFDRRNSIVAHLLSQSDHLIPAFKLVPESLKRAVANRMLAKAIQDARK